MKHVLPSAMENKQDQEPDRFGTPTNPSLIYRFVFYRNDHKSAEDFINKYSQVIRSYLGETFQDPSLVDDIEQEVFIKLMASLHTFKHNGLGSFRAWLKKVVASVQIDCLKNLQPKIPGEILDKELFPSFYEDLSDRIAKEYDQEIMMLAMKRVQLEIDPRTWEMFDLTKIKGILAEDVAKTLGVAKATVYHACHRVLKRLREMVIYLDTMKA